MKVFIT